MVRNIDSSPWNLALFELDIASNLKKPEDKSQAETNKILQIFSPKSYDCLYLSKKFTFCKALKKTMVQNNYNSLILCDFYVLFRG